MNRTIIYTLLPVIALCSIAAQPALSKAAIKASVADSQNISTSIAQGDTKATARDTANLRCWQEGKLLFEETHLNKEGTSAPKNAMIFSAELAADATQQIHVFEAGSATCMYKKI